MDTFRKQLNKEEKARAKEEKAAEKAEKLAAKNAPKPEVIYDDFTELFDKEAYDAEKAAEAAAVEAVKAEARALKEAKRDEKDAKREAKMSDKYDAATEKSIAKHEKKAELKVLGRDSIKENKDRKIAAREAEKADRLAKANAPKPMPLYPDPELLFNEVDVETKTLIETAPGDVLEGYRPKMVAAADLIRASKEDKQLKLLIKKDKGTVKRVKRELATLELAEKYVDNGSLDLADTKTVVKDAKQFKKDEFEKRLIKDYDNEIALELADEEKIKLAAEDKITRARVKKLEKRAKTYGKNGKFMLEYGSTYDPEWDGEFNHYGLPEIHPYTEGVKLSTSRRRTDKKERFSYFNKNNLSELAKLQCKTDINMVEARVEYDYIALQLDVAKFEQDYSGEFRNKKEKRWYRESKEKLKNLKNKIASAKRFEELDNERYYSVVATNFDKVKLPDKADRDELIAMREELMRLLDIRDEINKDLYELYTGTESGMKGSIKGRAKVTLKARKRAHAGYSRFFRVINKRRVTRNEKMRIFDKMDEIVELKGEVAKIKYILRNEKPQGKVKRAYQKELKGAKRDIRILKKAVQSSTIKALRKAKKREVRTWTMILAYSVLILLSLFTLSMVWFGPEVLRASKEFIFPENMHQYIDFLIKNWPF